VLIERDREVERLLELLSDAVDGEGRLVFVGGEAGVGKTSLMSAVAAAAPSGVEVRWGAADTLTAAAALGAVVDALPELQEMVGDPAGVDRLELFRRVRSMLASGSALLALEDLHWADEATLDLLRFLGRRLSGLRALQQQLRQRRDDQGRRSQRYDAGVRWPGRGAAELDNR
jgi:predicted ATPase